MLELLFELLDSNWAFVPLGFLLVSLLVGPGIVVAFHVGPDAPNGSVSDVESYPVGPEKPTPLNSSNVGDYTSTYEERLFYNDLLASRNHRLDADESVTATCTPLSVSNASTDEFRVQLACRGEVTDASQRSASAEFTYSTTYRVTTDTTRQTELQNYPFGTDRTFNNESDHGSSS